MPLQIYRFFLQMEISQREDNTLQHRMPINHNRMYNLFVKLSQVTNKRSSRKFKTILSVLHLT